MNDTNEMPKELQDQIRGNRNALVEPESVMDTATNIESALAAVEDWFARQNDTLDFTGFGIWLLVESARDAAHWVHSNLDSESVMESRREHEGDE